MHLFHLLTIYSDQINTFRKIKIDELDLDLYKIYLDKRKIRLEKLQL